MFPIIFSFVAVFATIFEVVTWRYFIRKWKSKPIKIAYLTITLLVWCVSIGSFALFGSSFSQGAILWIIYALIFNIAVKKSATIAALIGWIGGWKSKTRPSWVGKVAWGLVGVVSITMIYGATFGRLALRVENIEIISDKIPKSFDGYKIVQFSDLHLGNLNLDNDLVERIVEVINAQNADLVVQTGDLVNLHAWELNEEYIEDFKKIESKDGFVSVLGNHDLGFYLKEGSNITPKSTYDEIIRLQTDVLGWKLLNNENFSIHRGEDSIDISGVKYPSNLNHNNFNSQFGGSDVRKSFEGLNDSTFRVLLAHNPRMLDSLPQKGQADLILSGHVHNMQLAINLFGKEYSPASLIYKPFSGLTRKDNMILYINDGAGYVLFPFRLGSRPEITVFTLRSSK